jgi:predicted GNAT family acetyltransferase
VTAADSRVGLVRPALPADRAEVDALLARDPVAHCFVTGRVRQPDPWHGDLYAFVDGDRIASLLYVGANLVPVETTPRSRAAFADHLRPRGRRCSSFVGPAEEVLDLWRLLEPAWGPARAIRERQLVMAIDRDPIAAPDPLVRQVRPEELDLLLPACVAMFTEEVGVSPVAGGLGGAYRSRIAELISAGRALARLDDDGRVVFKAEIGVVGDGVCQVQGVWVDPALRGRGLGTAGMAAVVEQARRSIAPTVSLYVNDFNTAARRAYLGTGFRETGEFATVLF